MSQLLVVFFNNTPDDLQFVNIENTNNNQTVSAGQMFRTDNHFNIPDMSSCPQYFSQHHMEIQSLDGATTFFSFWDNDDVGYDLYYCIGTNCTSTSPTMPGYFNGGNNATVGIIVSGAAPYSISACEVMNNV